MLPSSSSRSHPESEPSRFFHGGIWTSFWYSRIEAAHETGRRNRQPVMGESLRARPAPSEMPRLVVDVGELGVHVGHPRGHLLLRADDADAVGADRLGQEVRGPQRDHGRRERRDRTGHVVRRAAGHGDDVSDLEAIGDPGAGGGGAGDGVAGHAHLGEDEGRGGPHRGGRRDLGHEVRGVEGQHRGADRGHRAGHVVRGRAGDGHDVADGEAVRDPGAGRPGEGVARGPDLGERELRSAGHVHPAARHLRHRPAVAHLGARVDEPLVRGLVAVDLGQDVVRVVLVGEVADHEPGARALELRRQRGACGCEARLVPARSRRAEGEGVLLKEGSRREADDVAEVRVRVARRRPEPDVLVGAPAVERDRELDLVRADDAALDDGDDRVDLAAHATRGGRHADVRGPVDLGLVLLADDAGGDDWEAEEDQRLLRDVVVVRRVVDRIAVAVEGQERLRRGEDARRDVGVAHDRAENHEVLDAGRTRARRFVDRHAGKGENGHGQFLTSRRTRARPARARLGSEPRGCGSG